MIYAGILAAGAGERMHRQDLPKQFLGLGSKPIIIHTLEQFFINPQIDRIVIVAPNDLLQYTEDLVNEYDTMRKEISVIDGGENKTISVSKIVDYIADNHGIKDGDILLTHDAVRPFVTQRMINENIDATREYGAASTVMTTNDTVIVSNDGKTLTEVPSKNKMFAEQTPLTFKLKMLAEMFQKANELNIPLMDETEIVRLFISQGYEVRLVPGEYYNMKIINPYDLEVAEALLQERKT